MRVHLLDSPFRHWVSGLLFEILAFAVFVASLFLLTLLITWIF